jgi:hypothetical protein
MDPEILLGVSGFDKESRVAAYVGLAAPTLAQDWRGAM